MGYDKLNTTERRETPKPEWSKDGFQIIPNVIFDEVRQGKRKLVDILIYAAFRMRAGEKGYTWIGNETLMNLVGKCERTVSDSIRDLETGGHIERKDGDASSYYAPYTHLRTYLPKGALKPIIGVPLKEPEPETQEEQAPEIDYKPLVDL